MARIGSLLLFAGLLLALPIAGLAFARAQEGAEQRAPTHLLQGALLDVDGNALVGRTLRLTAVHDVNWSRTEGYDLPADGAYQEFEPVETVTDEQGHFEVGFESREDHSFQLAGSWDDLEPIEFSVWWEELPGGPLDLGEHVIGNAGTLRGQVRDGNGTAIALSGQAFLQQIGVEDPFLSALYARVAVDPETGRFEFEHLPHGEFELRFTHPLAGSIEGPVVQIAGGQEPSCAVPVPGAPFGSKIVVRPRLRPQHWALEIAPGALVLQHPDGRRAPFKRSSIENPMQSEVWELDGISPGSYTVRLEDPQFLPAELTDVVPGSSHTLPMEGSVSLQLVVLDPAGEPFQGDLQADTRFRAYRGSLTTPSTFRLFRARKRPDDNLLTGVLAVPQRLLFEAPGVGTAEIELLDLAAGERRTIEFRLQPQHRLAGRLLEEDGRPLAGVSVQALELDDGEYFGHRQIAGTRTDTKGQFELTAPATREAVIEICPPGHRRLYFDSTEALLAAPGWPDLRLPAPGRLVGRVFRSPGDEATLANLHVERLNEVSSAFFARAVHGDTSDGGDYEIGAEAHYAIEDLGPGEYMIWLDWPADPDMYQWPVDRVLSRFTLGAGEQFSLDLDLTAGMLKELRVTSLCEALPGEQAQLTLDVQMGGGQRTFDAHTDSQGRAVFNDLPPGTATLGRWIKISSVSGMDMLDGEARLFYLLDTLELAAGELQEFQHSLDLTSSRIQLVDAEGQPLPDVSVTLRWVTSGSDAPGGFSVLTTDASGYLELNLPAGSFKLTLSHLDQPCEPRTVTWPPAPDKRVVCFEDY